MLEITQYVCEKCNTHYDTPEEATECENKHLDIKEIVPKYEAGVNAPSKVTIIFENDLDITYKC